MVNRKEAKQIKTRSEKEAAYLDYPPNPDYGRGVFRRRIRLTGSAGKVFAALEDCSHGFTVTVHHDGVSVTDIQTAALRIPLTSCGGATEPIKRLVGAKLQDSSPELHLRADPRANCTHILDLSVLAIAHALRGECARQYDVEVSDEAGCDALLYVYRDGLLVHCWSASQFTLTAPSHLQGKTLFRGFAAWATEQFSGDNQEAAFVLQKGYFVAQARRYDINSLAGEAATKHKEMQGNCYSYSPGVVEQAFRTENSLRDFSDCEERLLTFK